MNADGYVSTGSGVLDTNMFAYCGNNSVNMVDESGKRYSKAYNEAIRAIKVAAWMGVVILPTATSKPKKSNSNVSKSSKSNKSVKSDTKKQLQIRDVTHEINFALKPYVIEAEAMKNLANAVPLYKPYVYGTFGILVNHNSVWDIKRQIPWEKTIGTTFPGYGVPVIYGGVIMTPEALGNYTYGYLGAAFGFSYQTLIDGSVGAAGLPRSIPGIENETNDWNYITMGYLNYYF